MKKGSKEEERGEKNEGTGEKDISVGCRSRVNSNASLGRAQWSTLYPCMSRSTGTAAWWRGAGGKDEGWRRRREAWRRPHQDKGRGRGETKGVNESESWQLRSLLWVSGCQVSRCRHDIHAFFFFFFSHTHFSSSDLSTGESITTTAAQYVENASPQQHAQYTYRRITDRTAISFIRWTIRSEVVWRYIWQIGWNLTGLDGRHEMLEAEVSCQRL